MQDWLPPSSSHVNAAAEVALFPSSSTQSAVPQNHCGLSALMTACSLHMPSEAGLLIRHGASIQLTASAAAGGFQGSTPLFIAAMHADLDTMAVLLSNSSSRGVSEICHAPDGKCLASVMVLALAEHCRASGPRRGRRARAMLTRARDAGVHLKGVDAGTRMTALMHACGCGNADLVMSLLQAILTTWRVRFGIPEPKFCLEQVEQCDALCKARWQACATACHYDTS